MSKLRANQILIQEVMNDPAAQASEVSKGTLRIATQAEVNGGSPYDNTTVVTPETLSKASIFTDHTSALNPHNGWMSVNNDVDTTGNVSNTGGVSIGLNCDSSAATGVSTIVIGNNATAQGTAGLGKLIGTSIEADLPRQIVIGDSITSASVTTDTINSVKIGGWGGTGTNKNLLHLMEKGKLELYGEEAQYIFPNYEPAGSPATLPVPSTTIEGGTVYSIDEKTLKFYNGSAWAALNADNWLHANNGSDFTTAPIGTGSNSISLGNNASTAAVADAIAIGTNVTAVVNGVSIGANSDALGTSSVALGAYAQATADGAGVAIGLSSSAAGSFSIAIGSGSSTAAQHSVALGYDSDTLLTNQIAIGHVCKSTSVTTDTTYSVKIGEGGDTNKNMLHLFSQGKLELYGAAAQFVMPNYVWGSPAVEPATAVEGGLVYDSTAQGLKLYNGVSWSALGGGGITAVVEDTTPQLGGNLDTNGNEIELTVVSETTISYGTTGAIGLDLSTGSYFYPTGATTGVITFSFNNVGAGSPATRLYSFTLELWGAAGSPAVYVWPASVKWPGGTEPTWTASAGSPLVNGYDVVSFVTRDGGTTWLGMLGGLAFA
jgi:hypothetical protein